MTDARVEVLLHEIINKYNGCNLTGDEVMETLAALNAADREAGVMRVPFDKLGEMLLEAAKSKVIINRLHNQIESMLSAAPSAAP